MEERNLVRYAVKLSYLGSAYHGWQIQPNGNTVQAEINRVFTTLLHEPIETIGAGRTDTGVHASYFVAHFDCTKPIFSIDDLLYRLNRILPHDIAVQSIKEVSPQFHSRFSAISRTYNYFITQAKDVFSMNQKFRYETPLNLDKMNEAANLLLHFSDFTSFAKLHSDNKTNLCKISEAFWTKTDNNLVFTISADRFLRNMVRAIVGTLIQVGLEKISIPDFCSIIEKQDRQFAGWSAPAHGLFLVDIKYPEILF